MIKALVVGAMTPDLGTLTDGERRTPAGGPVPLSWRVCSVLFAAGLLVLPACRSRPSPVTVVTSGGESSGLASRVEALERRVEHLERELMRRSDAGTPGRDDEVARFTRTTPGEAAHVARDGPPPSLGLDDLGLDDE